MIEPQHLTALKVRPPSEVAAMAVAVQANLVQLKVACGKRADLADSASEIQVPPPGAVVGFRETLITPAAIAQYDDPALLLRTHEVWGQFCLLCWYFYATDPQHPPNFKNLPAGQTVYCPTALQAKTLEIEKCLWRMRFEQRLRRDPDFKADPAFEAADRAAQGIPAMVLGEKVHQANDQNLLLGTCQFAGMLASARWTGDRRWDWGGPGIMELPGSPQV